MSFSENVADLVERAASDLVGKAEKWPRVPMGDFVAVLNGFPFKSGQFSDADGAPIIRIRDVTAGHTKTYYRGEIPEGYWVREGDLVVGMDGDFNSRIWESSAGLLNQRVCKLSPDPAVMEVQFLARILPGYLGLINEATPSVTVKHLSSKTLKETPVPVPPLPEQRRIVAKLDRLSARSAAARDHLARTTKLATRAKQAILTEAFRGGVSSKEHREYADRQEIDTPFAIPAIWEWKTAEELCEWITKGTTPKRNDLNSDGGDVPFIKVYNLTFDGSLDFTKEPTFVSKSIHEGFLKRSKVFPGDILMNIVGPPLGKVSVVPETHPEWNMNQAIAVFRAKDEVLPAFLAKWLLSEAYLSWATALSKATAGQRNLTLEICRRSPVPVPPLDEQAEIVRRIEAAFSRIDRLTEEASRAAHLLDRLDERLLAKAFRGELVPQNPDYEPAEALLTRIREARAANPKAKRGRRKAMV